MERGRFVKFGLSASAAALVLAGCTSDGGTPTATRRPLPSATTTTSPGKAEQCEIPPHSLNGQTLTYYPLAGWNHDVYVVQGNGHGASLSIKQESSANGHVISQTEEQPERWAPGHRLILDFRDNNPGIEVEVLLAAANEPPSPMRHAQVSVEACRDQSSIAT